MRALPILRKRWLWLLLALPFVVSSCKKDDSDVTVNDYCYIKSVTLGTIRRQTATLNTSYSGADYIMTINQRTGIIENRDSLPCGSQLSRVLVTIAFDGSTLSYREKGTDAGWIAYNSTDSLDFTKPLELFLTSNDNQSSRIYTLKVNVHKLEGDSLSWKQCDSEVAALADMNDMKAFVLGGKLMVLGVKASGIVVAERSSLESEGTWEETPTTGLPEGTDIQTLHEEDEVVYLSTPDGSIFYSSDAKEWNQTGSTYSAPFTLIEMTDEYCYVISEGKILRSGDCKEWEEECLDAETSFLPTNGIRSLTVKQANGNNRIVLVGQRDNKPNCMVWNKMWNESELEEDAEWTYFPLTPDNTIPLPRLEHLNLLPYDGKCIAFGGASKDEKHKALDALYVSQDFGITWRPTTTIRLPKELKGTEGCIASAVDKNHFIWIITKTQVWRGRLNRLGFAQQ